MYESAYVNDNDIAAHTKYTHTHTIAYAFMITLMTMTTGSAAGAGLADYKQMRTHNIELV